MPEKKERKSHIFERDERDHYVEPQWVNDRLFAVEDFGSNGILDPCAGWGRIPDAALKAGYKTIASDVVDRGVSKLHEFRKLDITALYDEVTYEWWRQADSIVTNPPFDQIENVARRCCALAAHKVALICPLRRLPAARNWMTSLRAPLSKVWILTPRPSMPSGLHITDGGKVGGGTVDFVWLVFDKTHNGPHTFDWLHRDE